MNTKFLLLFFCITIINANPITPEDDQETSLDDIDDVEKGQIEKEIMESEIGSRFAFPDESSLQNNRNDTNYQGDIILTEEQLEILNDEIGMRTGLIDEDYRWPKSADGLVRVPYHIDQVFSKFRIPINTL